MYVPSLFNSFELLEVQYRLQRETPFVSNEVNKSKPKDNETQ